ncbi:MAG: type I restriction-modification system subunit M [Brevinema sp.]
MNKQQLAAKIWEQANVMRSKIEANEYKDYILGFIFYKYLSDQQLKYLIDNGYDMNALDKLKEDDAELVKFCQEKLGYFIAYDDLFSTWIKKGLDFEIANVRDALSAFNRLINKGHRKLFDGVFDTLQTGLSKLGESAAAQTKSARELIYLINEIPMDGKQDYDVLGFIYEYLIGMFAANAGKKAGEFYTPHEVSVLMAEIISEYLKSKDEIEIYDPTSGSGSLLINIGKAVSKHTKGVNSIKYYAQELKQNTYNLTRMNLIMRGIKPDNICVRNGDTLEQDWPYFDENDPTNTYNPLYVDAVVSNPPYSQKWDPTHKESDARYSRFGLAPKTKADYAFLLHDLYHLRPDGIMTIVLPHGVLFRGGEEGTIRKNLIEYNHIDTIIGLPPNIFFGTGIPTIVMVLKKNRTDTSVLIVDASKGFVKEGKSNKLRASDIKKIVDTVTQRKEIKKYSSLVSQESIRQNEYNLNIPRYVDSSEETEAWDIYASMFGGIPKSELDELHQYWEAFPSLRETIFKPSNTPYVELATTDIKSQIMAHPDVVGFNTKFHAAFDGLASYFKGELITKLGSLIIPQQEINLSNNIFDRVNNLPLIDKYQAYQHFSDAWAKISVDLEIIQTEGFDAVKKVDPNMVIKKKDGKETEVQDGYLGRVIPFELIQQTILKDQANEIKTKEDRLSEILSEYEELLDSLTEEQKEQEFVKDGVSFVTKALATAIKDLAEETDEESKTLLATLNTVNELAKEEKTLKSDIKTQSEALHTLTKQTIEALSDDKARELLEQKWIFPLVETLSTMPNTIIDELVSKIQALADKYATTFEAVETEIQETEQALCALIDQLEGDAYDIQGLSELKSLFTGGKDA